MGSGLSCRRRRDDGTRRPIWGGVNYWLGRVGGGRKPAKIELSEKVRQELEKLVARHTTGQQKAQRARIILKAGEGKNHAEIARELKLSIDMARLWRARWLAVLEIGMADLSVEERLEDLTRPGAPSRLSADQAWPIEPR